MNESRDELVRSLPSEKEENKKLTEAGAEVKLVLPIPCKEEFFSRSEKITELSINYPINHNS